MTENKQPFSSIAKNGEEVRKIKKWQRVIPPVIGVIVMLLVLVYIFSLLFNRYGSFTISVKDFADRKYSLTLSETASFKRTTSRLNAAAANDITNISYNNIPKDVNDVDGAHNGENYLAYTFYLKNSGEETCNYRYSIIISKATSGIDAAARIRVYYNEDFYKSATDEFNYSGDFVDYSKPKTGENGRADLHRGRIYDLYLCGVRRQLRCGRHGSERTFLRGNGNKTDLRGLRIYRTSLLRLRRQICDGLQVSHGTRLCERSG